MTFGQPLPPSEPIVRDHLCIAQGGMLPAMPFASTPPAEQVTGRDKRRIAAVVTAILLVLAAVAVWAAVRPGAYGSSRDGCITVTVPSSTGGALLHLCGADARSLCKRAYAGTGKVPTLTRPQCRLAGITPAQASSAS